MSWNPEKAKQILTDYKFVKSIREVNKVAGFVIGQDRELALMQENVTKVSVYVSVAPRHMPDVIIDRKYIPSTTRSGRNADVDAICRSLGYKFHAFALHIKTEEAMHKLINWYQYT